MHQRFSPIGLLTLMIVAAITGCTTTPPSAQHRQASASRVPYRLDQPDKLPPTLHIPLQPLGGHLVVHTSVNGQWVGSFLLDTGSNVNGIDMGIAARLQLPKRGRGNVTGIGGHQAYYNRQIQTLSIGRTLALPLHRLIGLNLLAFNRATNFYAAGIIGYPALRGVAFTIDASRPRLTIYRPGAFTPPPHARKARLYHFHRLPMIRATLAHRHKLFLIIDTGADKGLYLPSAALQHWPGILGVPETGPGFSTGIGGSVGGKRSWVKSLTLFNLDLHDVPTTFEDGPPMVVDGRLVGRIGNALLKHLPLTFSRNRHTIWAQWRPRD